MREWFRRACIDRHREEYRCRTPDRIVVGLHELNTDYRGRHVMLLRDAVDIVRLMNVLWAFDDRNPVSGEPLQRAREYWPDARCSESIRWYSSV